MHYLCDRITIRPRNKSGVCNFAFLFQWTSVGAGTVLYFIDCVLIDVDMSRLNLLLFRY
jgi:hypothetical protein